MRESAEAVGISIDWVYFILLHELHIKELCAGWVPRLLTREPKILAGLLLQKGEKRSNRWVNDGVSFL